MSDRTESDPDDPDGSTRPVANMAPEPSGQMRRWLGWGSADTQPTVLYAAVAGAIAACVALATTDLVGALTDPAGPSVVTSVGTTFIDRFAGPLKEPAVRLFGTNDKVALVVGIVLVCLLSGAGLGVIARRSPRMAGIGFAGFAVVGIAAGFSDELASRGSVAASALCGAAAGITAMHLLLRRHRSTRSQPSAFFRADPGDTQLPAGTTSARSPDRVGYPTDPATTRRAFVAWGGAASAAALVAALGARGIRGRSAVENARTAATLPLPNRSATAPSGSVGQVDVANQFGIKGLTPYLTPSDRFYKIDTALLTPQVDVRDWVLEIGGMVEHPVTFNYQELLARATTEEAVTLSCVSNEVGGNLVGNAIWQGVPLRELLDEAGVVPGATQIVGRSVDGWTAGFPTEAAYDGRVALVAVAMNGEPLPAAHGFPARLIVAGLYGYVSATKWLRQIELTTWEGFDGYWIDKGWSKLGPVKTQSRIDVPRAGARLSPGRTPIAGVAWAPNRGIVKVEVQVDDGPWEEARLGDTLSSNTWRQWMLEWDAVPGEHRLRVRATDGSGETQTERVSPPDPDGATGWHTITVRVTD